MLFWGTEKYNEFPECHAQLLARWEQVHQQRQHRDQTHGDDYPSIPEFYKGRHVFMTGASGFLGKVILEKLLRDCPDIGNVYVLLRPRRGQDAESRISGILQVPLFDRLRKDRPSALQKVVPVSGDCSVEGLGLSANDRQMLVDAVSVVIHGAASVRFNDPIKRAVNMNTRGAREIASLAKEMSNLKVLVHISTAYCFTNNQPTRECTYPTPYDWKDIIRLAQLPDSHVLDTLGPKFMDFQPNTYVFSKSYAERVMEDASHELPIVIVRPSIVIGSIGEPLPGWMDNLNGFGAFWVIASKGIMRVHHSVLGPNMKFDLVPVDTVSDVTIAASWAKGIGQPLQTFGGNAEVVNISCGDTMPGSSGLMQKALHRNVEERRLVYPGAIRYPKFVIVSNKYLSNFLKLFYHLIFGMVLDILLITLQRKPMVLSVYRKMETATASMGYFNSKEFVFDTANFWNIQGMLHPSDRNDWSSQMTAQSWAEYDKDQYIGVCEYALKEHLDTNTETSGAWKHVRSLWWAEVCWYTFLATITVWIAVKL